MASLSSHVRTGVRLTSSRTRLVPVRCQGPSATVAVTERIELKPGMVNAVEAGQMDSLFAAAETKVVVVDVYTTWCGPCKVIAPELEKIAAEMADGCVVAKLDCTQSPDNKKWAMQHNVKALPTFILFKEGKRVNDMTGAKAAALRKLIESHI